MSFGHALYYPHIDLTNKNWIKHAFLFWDNISRIVPKSVHPSDNEDIIRIIEHTGFVKDYSPEKWDVSHAFHEFSEFLIRFARSDRFYKHFGIPENQRHDYDRDYQRFRDDTDYRYNIIKESTLTKGTWVHVEKLDKKLKKMLIDIGLAFPGKNEWEDWVKIDNEIGFMYMSYLAKSISKEQSLPIVTDAEAFFSTSSVFEQQVFRDYNAEFEYKLGNLLISCFIPKNINAVSVEKLIEIREKYSAERYAFFNKITQLCSDIPNIDNKSTLNDALKHYGTSLEIEAKQLKNSFEINKIETVKTVIGFSVPTILGSLTESIPTEYKPLGIGAGILFGLAFALNGIKKEREQLQQKPLSYLLNINSELSSDSLFHKINDSIKGLQKWS